MDAPYDVIVCETDDEWHELRSKGIGGSEVSTILGINKYSTPVELWLVKTGRVQPKDLSDKESVEWGNILEPVIRAEFARRHPEFEVSESKQTLVSVERPWAHANLDGTVVADGEIGVLEIKTVGERRASDWDDGVPDYYLAQVTHYLSVTGWGFAYVVALIGGQRYVEFRVDRDEGDIRAVNEAVDTFWNEFVLKDVMPAMVGTSGESAAMFDAFDSDGDIATPENFAHFDALVEEYQQAKAMADHYADIKRRLGNELRAAVGGHKGAKSDVFSVSWVRTYETRIDGKRLMAELPEIAERYGARKPKDMGIRIRSLT